MVCFKRISRFRNGAEIEPLSHPLMAAAALTITLPLYVALPGDASAQESRRIADPQFSTAMTHPLNHAMTPGGPASIRTSA